MSQNNLDQQHRWHPLGQGAYNKTFLSRTSISFLGFFGYVVKKQPKDPYEPMSNVDRVARKAHEIYPEMPVQVEKHQPYSIRLERPPLDRMQIIPNAIYLYETSSKELGACLYTSAGSRMGFITNSETNIIPENKKRFLLDIACRRIPLTEEFTAKIIKDFRLDKHFFYMPFYGTTQPSDEEIAIETLNIYRNSRNIIADAGGYQNFKKVNHQAICIDYDCAIRRGSFDSDTFMSSEETQADFRNYWNDLERRNINTKTNRLVKSLFYLENYLTIEQITNDILRIEVIEKLNILRQRNHPITLEDIAIIQGVIDVFPNHHQYNQSFTPEILTQFRELKESPDFVQHIERLLIMNQPIDEHLIMAEHSTATIEDLDESVFSSPEI